jgi:hypothetical protein
LAVVDHKTRAIYIGSHDKRICMDFRAPPHFCGTGALARLVLFVPPDALARGAVSLTQARAGGLRPVVL